MATKQFKAELSTLLKLEQSYRKLAILIEKDFQTSSLSVSDYNSSLKELYEEWSETSARFYLMLKALEGGSAKAFVELIRGCLVYTYYVNGMVIPIYSVNPSKKAISLLSQTFG